MKGDGSEGRWKVGTKGQVALRMSPFDLTGSKSSCHSIFFERKGSNEEIVEKDLKLRKRPKRASSIPYKTGIKHEICFVYFLATFKDFLGKTKEPTVLVLSLRFSLRSSLRIALKARKRNRQRNEESAEVPKRASGRCP